MTGQDVTALVTRSLSSLMPSARLAGVTIVVEETMVKSVEVWVERVVLLVIVTTVGAVEVWVWVIVEVLVERSVGKLDIISS